MCNSCIDFFLIGYRHLHVLSYSVFIENLKAGSNIFTGEEIETGGRNISSLLKVS